MRAPGHGSLSVLSDISPLSVTLQEGTPVKVAPVLLTHRPHGLLSLFHSLLFVWEHPLMIWTQMCCTCQCRIFHLFTRSTANQFLLIYHTKPVHTFIQPLSTGDVSCRNVRNGLNLYYRKIFPPTIPLSPHLYHACLPTDPEAAELVPGQDAWCGGTDQGLTHLAQGDPGASVLPSTKHDL